MSEPITASVASIAYPIRSKVTISDSILHCALSLPENMLSMKKSEIYTLVGLVLSWLEDAPMYVKAKRATELKPIPGDVVLQECEIRFLLSYNENDGYKFVTEIPDEIKSLDDLVQMNIMLSAFEQLLGIEEQYRPGMLTH